MTDFRNDFPPTNSFDRNYRTFAHSHGVSFPDRYVITVTLDPRNFYEITFIRIINRHDCCRQRLLGFTLYVGSLNGGESDYGAIEEVKSDYGFSKVEIGDKVELRNSGSIHTAVNFAEIVIYGTPYLGRNQLIF